jgi:NAD+ synthase
MNYKLTDNQIKTVIANGSKALFDYCAEHQIHYLVTGSSGGLDSAVTLGFAAEAEKIAKKENYPLTSIGLIMPCHSHPISKKLGIEAIKKFGAKKIEIELSDSYDYLAKSLIEKQNIDGQIKSILKETGGEKELESIERSEKIASGNIKVRLRMMLGTYHVARMTGGIVLSTDNFSEFLMGFWTICGDVGDFGIIQKIFKGLELYDIAKKLGVPEDIIKAKPDDGLGIGAGDADQLGAEYPLIDEVMIRLMQKDFETEGSSKQLENLPEIAEMGISQKTITSLAKRCLETAHKRRGTIVVSRKELGLPAIEEIKL